VLDKHSVSGPFATYYRGYYGSATRVLPFDVESATFYLAEQWDPESGAYTPKSPLVLFGLDARSGASTVTRVTGCEAALAVGRYPVGMAWDAVRRALVVGVQNATSAAFCSITPATGAGVDMAILPRGATEQAAGYYAAFLSHAADGVVTRVGHRLVSTGAQPGYTTTRLSASEPNVTFSVLDFGSVRHGLPASIKLHPDGGFVSLAPRTSGKPSYDVMRWATAAGAPPEVLAELRNAYPPSIPLTSAPLGYVEDATAGSWYAAMAVKRSDVSAVGDKWAVHLLDLKSGAVLSEAPLDPQPSALGAETTSLCGFGLGVATA